MPPAPRDRRNIGQEENQVGARIRIQRPDRDEQSQVLHEQKAAEKPLVGQKEAGAERAHGSG
jgi:hypothetical protein